MVTIVGVIHPVSTARAAASVPSSSQADSAGRSVWDGVYNDEQAKRGGAIYSERCALCHGSQLSGGEMAPPLTGAAFTSNWNGLTLGDLLERIRLTMPPDQPGTLTRQEYVDVISFVLKAGQFPAGQKELDRQSELLKQIRFEATRPQH